MATVSSLLQYAGIFAIPIGLAVFVAVVLYAEAIRLHREEEARLAQRLAHMERIIRPRPVVRARTVLQLPAPPDFEVTCEGVVVIRRAA